MTLSGSKRGHSSESSPPRRNGVPPSTTTEGAREYSQNRSLALETELERNNEVQPEENPSSIMSLGLETKKPAERRSLSGFREFLKACGWCKKKISHVWERLASPLSTSRHFANLNAKQKRFAYFTKNILFEAGLPEHLGVDVKQR